MTEKTVLVIFIISESRGLNPRTRSTSSDQFENRTSLNLDTQFKTTEQSSDVPHIDMTKDILIEEEKTEEGKVSEILHSLIVFSFVYKNVTRTNTRKYPS